MPDKLQNFSERSVMTVMVSVKVAPDTGKSSNTRYHLLKKNNSLILFLLTKYLYLSYTGY